MAEALAIIRQLRTEAATAEAFELALSTVATLVHNVLAHPEDAKYRIVRLANATFHARLGQYLAGLSLLRSFGFEDAFQGADKGEKPTHLAIAEADAGQLAQCLVLVEAARLASRQVADEEQHQQQQPAGAPSDAGHVLPGGAAASLGSRASGKRPIAAMTASTEPSGKRAMLNSAPGGGTSAVASSTAVASGDDDSADESDVEESAVELESYCAASINAYFVLHVGDCGAQLNELTSQSAFERLVTTARDARSIALATADAEAEARAVYWLTLLVEHGVLNGWAEVEGAETGAETTTADGRGGMGDGEPGAVGASADGTHDGADSYAAEEVQADGNFDSCAVCGGDGSLVCCDACPQAYHIACLGDRAPPEDEDEDKAWFCPPCAQQLGVA